MTKTNKWNCGVICLMLFVGSISQAGPNCRIHTTDFTKPTEVPDGSAPTVTLPSGTKIFMQNYEGGFSVDVFSQQLNFQLQKASSASIRFLDQKSGQYVSVLCSTITAE